ncbi:hypothetical protein Pstr01_23670 [Pseudomonas straminea]|nr:hypothetical protein Pstr01_23670 [Pseudomonas straminea]
MHSARLGVAMHLICEVEDTFDLPRLGCVIAPGVPVDFQHSVTRGARLAIEEPTGKWMDASVKDMLMIRRNAPFTHIPFSLENDVGTVDVPRGSKIFLLLEP